VAVLLLVTVPLLAASPAPKASAAPRNDYLNPAFTAPLGTGLREFYTRDFAGASKDFQAALAVVPDNTLAISMLNATATQTPGDLDALVESEEDALVKQPKSAQAPRPRRVFVHVRLADRTRPDAGRTRGTQRGGAARPRLASGAHRARYHAGGRTQHEPRQDGVPGRAPERSANVLAREYLSLIYQDDLKDPQRALTTVIDVPNLVPDYADIYFHIASLLHDLRQYDAAIGYATRGLEADVGHVGESGQHGYTLLARIYLDDKKPDDARRVLRASIAAGSDVGYATTLLKRIDDGAYGESVPSPAPSGTPSPKRKKK